MTKQTEVSCRSFRAAFEGEEQDQHGAKSTCDTESCESSTEIVLHGHEAADFIEKYKESSSNDVEQQQLIECMKSTIGIAVGNMEEAIKGGTIWCPSSQEHVVANTPKNSNKMPHRSSSSSSNVMHTKRTIIMSSIEKDLSNCSNSDNEDYDTCLSEQKTFCSAGNYCWKEDSPKSFTVTCSLCGGKCHERCTTHNQDTGAINCDRCVREL